MKHDTIIQLSLSVLCRANITPTQYTFLWLLHTKNNAALVDYVRANRGFPRHEVKDLHERGYISYVNDDSQEKCILNSILVTEKFTSFLYEGQDSVIISEEDAFNELFFAYPPFINIQGRMVSARTISIELGGHTYHRIIKGQRSQHKEIIEDVEFGKNNNMINMGLSKFLESRQWLGIRQIRTSKI